MDLHKGGGYRVLLRDLTCPYREQDATTCWLITLVFRNVSPAVFSLKYNVMPYVGLLTYGEAARTTGFEVPEALDAVS